LLALQTGVPGEGVNSRCNLGNAASATAAPRSRTSTPTGYPAMTATYNCAMFLHAGIL
jgi:hypothetical protein